MKDPRELTPPRMKDPGDPPHGEGPRDPPPARDPGDPQDEGPKEPPLRMKDPGDPHGEPRGPPWRTWVTPMMKDPGTPHGKGSRDPPSKEPRGPPYTEGLRAPPHGEASRDPPQQGTQVTRKMKDPRDAIPPGRRTQVTPMENLGDPHDEGPKGPPPWRRTQGPPPWRRTWLCPPWRTQGPPMMKDQGDPPQ